MVWRLVFAFDFVDFIDSVATSDAGSAATSGVGCTSTSGLGLGVGILYEFSNGNNLLLKFLNFFSCMKS